MSENTQTSQHGRRRLIEAALDLSYQKRSFSSLGIREISRQAKLSAPAFYRHFTDLADLGTAVIKEVEVALIAAFREVRKSTESESELDIRPLLIQRFFQWSVDNPKHVVIGCSEAFGAMEAMRRGVRSTIQTIAEDICTDPRIAALLPDLPENELREMLFVVAQNVLFQAVDYIEHPDSRTQVYERTLRIVDVLFAGAHTIRALQLENTSQ